jgi:hypothetical protein
MIFELNYRNEREWTDGTKPIIQITITMEIDENLERPSPNAIIIIIIIIIYQNHPPI